MHSNSGRTFFIIFRPIDRSLTPTLFRRPDELEHEPLLLVDTLVPPRPTDLPLEADDSTVRVFNIAFLCDPRKVAESSIIPSPSRTTLHTAIL